MRPRLYMFEPLERFARITITGMLLCLIQKCLSKPTITPPLPPSRTNPHIFSRQNEVVKLPLRYSFFQKHSLILQSFWTNITLAGSFEGVFTSLLCGHLFFGGQLVYFEAP